MALQINPPLTDADTRALRAGDEVVINGVIYTARDAAHKRLVGVLEKGEELPLELEGQVIYYTGPTPPLPGRATGSAGPTTSSRMDVYTPSLLECGLKAVIGKGDRSDGVIDALNRHGAVYLAAVGGAGALLAERISAAEIILYPELGPEAIYRLEVVDFPAIVAIDSHAADLYRSGSGR
ncbi:MAG: Fe-S-containing hydro-lyase [Actinomycetota bacterium]